MQETPKRQPAPGIPQPTLEQARAITLPPGPVLILAGPGAGKTLTLTQRAARLAGSLAPHETVLCVTFTNRAARELVERLEALGTADVVAGTFHAISHRLVRPNAPLVGRSAGFSIYDARSARKLVEEALGPDPRHGLDPASAATAISLAKARLETPALLRERDPALAAAWARYELLLERSDALDFDDLIARCVWLLERPGAAERIRRRFGALLVDEYQDTNPAQYRWVELLAAGHRNVAVICDDDQAIYGFRSADVRNVAAFERDFPDAACVVLERNHRSTGPIVRAARRLIAHNRERRPKALTAVVEQGPQVRSEAYANEHAEAHGAARWCERLVSSGRPPGDVAVLYRTRDQARPVEEALVARRVPHHVLGGQGFFERAEVRDALAHLALVVNPADRVALARALGSQPGIGPVAVARVAGFAADSGLDPVAACAKAGEIDGLRGGQAPTLARLGEALTACAERQGAAGVAGTVTAVVLASGIPGRLREGGGRDRADRLERLRQLIRSARAYERDADTPTLVEFLGHAALAASEGEGPDDRVTLATIHAAKGLEWGHVRVIGLEEGLMPHRRAISAAELEEERRLAYVALTRARRELVLSRARSRRQAPVAASRFIAEALGDEELAS